MLPDKLGSAYLQSMDCQREPQSKHPTGKNPGIYTVGVPFLVLVWDRVPRDAAAAGHTDMVMYCLESSRQYPEWEYKDSIMLAAPSEQRWHVIDALNKMGHSWPESGPEQASVADEGVPLTIQEVMDKFEISQCRCECNGAGYDTSERGSGGEEEGEEEGLA